MKTGFVGLILGVVTFGSLGFSMSDEAYEAWIDGYMHDFRAHFSEIAEDSPMTVTIFDYSDLEFKEEEITISDAKLASTILNAIKNDVEASVREQIYLDEDRNMVFVKITTTPRTIIDVSWPIKNTSLVLKEA